MGILGDITGGIATSSGSSLISGAINNMFAKQQQKQQLKNQKALFDYQFGLENQRQDFLLNNQATMQMNANKAAGLNPALMSEGNFQTAAVSQPNPSAPAGQSATQMDIAGSIAALQRADKENKLLDSEYDLNKAREKRELAAAGESSANAKRIETLTPQELTNLVTQNDYMDKQSRKLAAEIPYAGQLMLASIQEMLGSANLHWSNVGKTRSEMRKLTAETSLLYNQFDKISAEIGLTEAKQKEVYAYIGLMSKQGAYYQAYADYVSDPLTSSTRSQGGLWDAQAAYTRGPLSYQTRWQGNLNRAHTGLAQFEQGIKNRVGADKYSEMVVKGFKSSQWFRYTSSVRNLTGSVKDLSDAARNWVDPKKTPNAAPSTPSPMPFDMGFPMN